MKRSDFKAGAFVAVRKKQRGWDDYDVSKFEIIGLPGEYSLIKRGGQGIGRLADESGAWGLEKFAVKDGEGPKSHVLAQRVSQSGKWRHEFRFIPVASKGIVPWEEEEARIIVKRRRAEERAKCRKAEDERQEAAIEKAAGLGIKARDGRYDSEVKLSLEDFEKLLELVGGK